VARSGASEERERYMDSLEQQMEDQRERIQRTLDRTMEGSDRRRTVIEKLRSSLPNFPNRTPVRHTRERETHGESVRGEGPAARKKRVREPSESTPWWRRMLGG
jgi:hypothetical protein